MDWSQDTYFLLLKYSPHSGICGSTPNPKKLKLLVAITAVPMVNDALTIIGAKELGTTCMKIIFHSDSPSALAASTNSKLETDSTLARIVLAYVGIEPTLKAIIKLIVLEPNAAIIAMASKIPGTA